MTLEFKIEGMAVEFSELVGFILFDMIKIKSVRNKASNKEWTLLNLKHVVFNVCDGLFGTDFLRKCPGY